MPKKGPYNQFPKPNRNMMMKKGPKGFQDFFKTQLCPMLANVVDFSLYFCIFPYFSLFFFYFTLFFFIFLYFFIIFDILSSLNQHIFN